MAGVFLEVAPNTWLAALYASLIDIIVDDMMGLSKHMITIYYVRALSIELIKHSHYSEYLLYDFGLMYSLTFSLQSF